jgi:hypothetical protein
MRGPLFFGDGNFLSGFMVGFFWKCRYFSAALSWFVVLPTRKGTRLDVRERLPIGVTHLETARNLLNGPWWGGAAHWQNTNRTDCRTPSALKIRVCPVLLIDTFEQFHVEIPVGVRAPDRVLVIIPHHVKGLASRVYPRNGASIFACGVTYADPVANLEQLHSRRPAIPLSFSILPTRRLTVSRLASA